jgi:hypothetical protein
MNSIANIEGWCPSRSPPWMSDGDTLGQVQRSVAINYTEKVAVSLSIGPPFDMAMPEDLRPPVDLAMPDLATPDLSTVDGMRTDGGPI